MVGKGGGQGGPSTAHRVQSLQNQGFLPRPLLGPFPPNLPQPSRPVLVGAQICGSQKSGQAPGDLSQGFRPPPHGQAAVQGHFPRFQALVWVKDKEARPTQGDAELPPKSTNLVVSTLCLGELP